MPKRSKVLLGPSSFAAVDKSPLIKLCEMGYEIVDNPYKRKLTREELIDLLPGVEGIIAGLEPLDRSVLEKSALKIISRCGSGLSNVDLDAAPGIGDSREEYAHSSGQGGCGTDDGLPSRSFTAGAADGQGTSRGKVVKTDRKTAWRHERGGDRVWAYRAGCRQAVERIRSACAGSGPMLYRES